MPVPTAKTRAGLLSPVTKPQCRDSGEMEYWLGRWTTDASLEDGASSARGEQSPMYEGHSTWGWGS